MKFRSSLFKGLRLGEAEPLVAVRRQRNSCCVRKTQEMVNLERVTFHPILSKWQYKYSHFDVCVNLNWNCSNLGSEKRKNPRRGFFLKKVYNFLTYRSKRRQVHLFITCIIVDSDFTQATKSFQEVFLRIQQVRFLILYRKFLPK